MKSVRLINYRCFKDTGELELRPLTLLIGTNSSGKSSFLRFFPALSQTLDPQTYGAFSFTNELVDLGSFDHTLYHGAKEREIGIELSLDVLEKLDRQANPSEEPPKQTSPLVNYRFEVTLGLRKDGIPTAKRQAWIREGELMLEIRHPGSLDPPSLSGRWTEFWKDDLPLVLISSTTEFLPRVPGVTRRSADGQFHTLGSSFAIDRTFRREFEQLGYLGPVREGPQRYYRLRQQAVNRIDMSGSNLAVFLHSLSPAERRGFSEFCQTHIGYGVDVSLSELNLSIQLFETREPQRKTNLIDLGYGFSQLLPVLAQLWLLSNRRPQATRSKSIPSRLQNLSLLCIEQPELHVHPRLQAKLAELLTGVLQAATSDADPTSTGLGPTLIIETHSEPLINRLGELVELGKLKPQDVTVMLFERDPALGFSTVRQTEFDERGILKDWPIGFLAG